MANQGRAYAGYKQPDWADPSKGDIDGQPGIYVGVVKEIVTGTRNGAVRVYIPAFGGDENDENGWNQCTYASPFLGSTTGYNNQLQLNNYDVVKQTYGFFMTPPDPGNQVLCCFPPGRGSVGVWFACLTNDMSLYSIPAATPATQWTNIDAVSLQTGQSSALTGILSAGTPYPVGEFNELDPNTKKSDWIKNLRPINPYATVQLVAAGLDKDVNRGAISSSSQRDPISSVFGFNSPGRPVPQQDVKNIPNLQDQINQGTFDPTQYKVTNRVPGHSFVMDDGDVFGKNQLVRLKTAAGHQILMNDSEGFMYVSNATGTAWVELTKEGDVLIYGARDFSVRTQGNIQMHSDRDILINAGRYFNVNAPAVQIQGTVVTTVTGGQALQLYGGAAILKGKTGASIYSGGPMSIKAVGAMPINASTIALNGGGGSEPATPKPISTFLNPESYFVNNQWIVRTNSLQSACYRVPTHEPYVRGNIASIVQQQEDVFSTISNTTANITTVTGETVSAITAVPSKNIEDASTLSVVSPAPTSSFISEPTVYEGIGILTPSELQAYNAQTGYVYSNNTANAVNQYGYAGSYQLNSQALQDIGWLKPGTPQTFDAINNPNNWIGSAGGPASLDDFLENPTYQSTAMQNYTTQNYAILQANGIINNNTPPDQVAGLLSAAHQYGAADTVNWYAGLQTTNATPDQFAQAYQQGAYSQSQAGTITASQQSKTIIGA